MGHYLDPGSERFQTSLRSQIYVDKTMLIARVNAFVKTEQKYICVSRPRRFGKSMAADMLSAYYSFGTDASELFNSLKIASDPSYTTHKNHYHVIKLNMQEFLSATESIDEMLKALQKRVLSELRKVYPELVEGNSLMWTMMDIYAETKRSFVVLIDEWDCLFREYADDIEAQKKYLDFLRMWLKDQDYIALAYMTGILPIKKYGTHSALNMFTEFSMTDPGALAEYFGFTETEVEDLCASYGMSFEETKAWYDGYDLVTYSRDGSECHAMYSPKSVVEAMLRHKFGTYWNQTETYEALRAYIQMNLDGLKDAVVQMLAGEPVEIRIGTFNNDMTTFHSRDDVLTLLVHLGYLSYDAEAGTVSIPNKEVEQEYINAISTMDWTEVMRSVNASKDLLQAMWNLDAEAVAKGIDRAHDEVSILKYNDENSLSCTISLAFYYAREYYTVVRELPTGKGYADICLIPRPRYTDKPAVIIELKKGRDAAEAIDQIKRKEYSRALETYRGNLLLVGINYDEKKRHTCIIEKLQV
ncbi:MAG: AAA family ATPase [Lachnospiraceae bacterium]|nr:AAA family ATPase [Lachnospiraceae bacterium]